MTDESYEIHLKRRTYDEAMLCLTTQILDLKAKVAERDAKIHELEHKLYKR